MGYRTLAVLAGAKPSIAFANSFPCGPKRPQSWPLRLIPQSVLGLGYRSTIRRPSVGRFQRQPFQTVPFGGDEIRNPVPVLCPLGHIASPVRALASQRNVVLNRFRIGRLCRIRARRFILIRTVLGRLIGCFRVPTFDFLLNQIVEKRHHPGVFHRRLVTVVVGHVEGNVLLVGEDFPGIFRSGGFLGQTSTPRVKLKRSPKLNNLLHSGRCDQTLLRVVANLNKKEEKRKGLVYLKRSVDSGKYPMLLT